MYKGEANSKKSHPQATPITHVYTGEPSVSGCPRRQKTHCAPCFSVSTSLQNEQNSS